MTAPTPQTRPMATDSPEGPPEHGVFVDWNAPAGRWDYHIQRRGPLGPRTLATRSTPAAAAACLEQIEGQP